MAGDEQVAAFVAPTDDSWMMSAVVERALQQAFERGVLLFDDEHLVEAIGEVARLRRIEWHRHQQLEQANTGGVQVVVRAETEDSQRLSDLVERVPTRGDADPVVDGSRHDAVQSVVDAVPASEGPADLLELALHVDRVGREQPTVGLRVERPAVDLDHRRRRMYTVGVHVDGSRPVGDGGHQLEASPQPTRARECDGVSAQVERFLHVAGEEDRHVQIDHRGVARRRQGRRLRGGVVTDDGDDPAVHRRAREHRMTDRVAAAVEPRTLAVPNADDAVVAGVVERHRQLAAHDGAGRQFLVDGGLHHDREVGNGGRRTLEFLGERADRRALVAGRERGGGEAEPTVEPQLIGGEPGDRLDPGEEHGAVLEPESVGELVRATRTGRLGLIAVDRHDSSLRRALTHCCTPTVRPRRANAGTACSVRFRTRPRRASSGAEIRPGDGERRAVRRSRRRVREVGRPHAARAIPPA